MDERESVSANGEQGGEEGSTQPAVGWQAPAAPLTNEQDDGASPLPSSYHRVYRATTRQPNNEDGAPIALADHDLEWTEVDVQGGRAGDRYIRYLRPRGQALTRSAAGEVLQVDEAASTPHSVVGRVGRFLVGKPIATSMDIHERLTKIKALAVLSSDALSSVAYATEQIVLQLAVAGALGIASATLGIAVAITLLLAIVAFSYRQTITAYPNGGGSYIVSRDNLGDTVGLTAASALMVDYILTVAVSISSGTAQLVSAVPSAAPYAVPLSLLFLALIVLGNLRGIRESGAIFAAPTYLFIISITAVIVIGLFQFITGNISPEPASTYPQVHNLGQNLSIFLILQAFAAGCSAMTGVEAISNGVPAFKKPEPTNARVTLVWMAVILGFMFMGISFLAGQYHILGLKGSESVISQIAHHTLGDNFLYSIYAVGVVLILVLAANTAFSDFPRLSSILARDRFLPNQFMFRGDRLAFNTGIISLAVLAGLLILIFDANTDELIPLYAVGVFISFTLSQAGMVVKWRRERHPGWQRSAVINGVGAVATGLVFLVIAFTKFNGGDEGKPLFKIGDFQVKEGAWIVMIIIPLMVAMFKGIYRHYNRVASELSAADPDEDEVMQEAEQLRHLAVVPISSLNRVAIHTLAYARSVFSKVQAIYVTDSEADAQKLQQRWEKLMRGSDVRLIILESPYRALVRPLVTYVDDVQRKYPDRQITVVLPEFVAQRWWEHILHNQTALRLKGALLFHPGIVVTSVPYHIGKPISSTKAEGVKAPPSDVAKS